MRKKTRSRGRKRKRPTQVSDPWFNAVRVKVAIRGVTLAAILLVLGVATVAGVTRLEAHVLDDLAQHAAPHVSFVDVPPSLSALALADLQASVAELLEHRWTDDDLCRQMATRVASVAWVDTVNHVRRVGAGQSHTGNAGYQAREFGFQISCRYRTPVAMVQSSTRFLLIDRHGVRLPGDYRYDESRILVQGATAPVPPPGQVWPGKDIATALDTIVLLEGQPFRSQITAVLVENFGGRLDSRASHIKLATDRPGSRIWWGSAPGAELEENSGPQKIAILLANYRRTGRADADRPVIDVSTFPDRFVIPG